MNTNRSLSPAPGRRIVFVDRDGTLVEEPPDEKVDSLAKIRLMPGVIPALLELKAAGFGFVMVTNQDGLGTPNLPRELFDPAHRFIVELFASQGIEFEAVFICPHYEREDCACRKPRIGLMQEFLQTVAIDRARSFMIGDRLTDLQFAANMGIEGLRVVLDGDAAQTWPAIAERIAASAAAASAA
jgi:imidazoleglycerol-phosphate dehydratase / histidinol-phosphatase